jgi:hypothetical protein
MTTALKLISARTSLMEIDGGGHELLPRSAETDIPQRIAKSFQDFIR